MNEPCPVCDVSNAMCTPTDAFALGVALGQAFGQAGTRELICNAHRTRYVMACMQAVIKIQGLDGRPLAATGAGEEPR